MFTADGPGRAKAMGVKHPNSFSKHPCAYCMCEQSDDVAGGQLGDASFDVDANRRTYGATQAGFEELGSLTEQPIEQQARSKELGLVRHIPTVLRFLYGRHTTSIPCRIARWSVYTVMCW